MCGSRVRGHVEGDDVRLVPDRLQRPRLDLEMVEPRSGCMIVGVDAHLNAASACRQPADSTSPTLPERAAAQVDRRQALARPVPSLVARVRERDLPASARQEGDGSRRREAVAPALSTARRRAWPRRGRCCRRPTRRGRRPQLRPAASTSLSPGSRWGTRVGVGQQASSAGRSFRRRRPPRRGPQSAREDGRIGSMTTCAGTRRGRSRHRWQPSVTARGEPWRGRSRPLVEDLENAITGGSRRRDSGLCPPSAVVQEAAMPPRRSCGMAHAVSTAKALTAGGRASSWSVG